MIENVPYVPNMDVSGWPKELHSGYAKNVVRRIDEYFTVDNPSPAQVQAVIDPLKAAVTKEDQDIDQSRTSGQTAQIKEADDSRDSLVDQGLSIIDTMSKATALAAMQQAALLLVPVVNTYKPSSKLALRTESEKIQQFLQAIHQSQELTAAVATLGLTQLFADLETQNDLVIQLMDERAADRAAQQSIQLSEDRKETDRWLRNFFRIMDAAACMDSHDDRYNTFLNTLAEDQKEWKRTYEDHLRANRRVRVLSTIVGNHYYSVSRDWTWERLLDDGKALLAIDDDDPTRILSTDKKAVKAGGLYLALDGVLVSPDDDIDCEVDYELIALDDAQPAPTPSPTPSGGGDDSGDSGGSGGEVTPVTPE